MVIGPECTFSSEYLQVVHKDIMAILAITVILTMIAVGFVKAERSKEHE